MAADLHDFASSGWLNIAGGCCGTTPAHIRAIADAVRGLPPHVPPQPERYTRFSGLEPLVLRPDSRFVNIGERTNVTGSPKFAKLILGGHFEEGADRRQAAGGKRRADHRHQHGRSHARFRAGHDHFLELHRFGTGHRPRAHHDRQLQLERDRGGLKCIQGKGIVNSISLKEGEEVFKQRARLIKRYGAGMVVMAFDEEGPGGLDGAPRGNLHALLPHPHGRSGRGPVRHHFDPNILTVATGMDEHRNYAVDYIEATRQIKATLPYAK
jgi:5-methyltetrahydrofolate--homocysteine methyltransferase